MNRLPKPALRQISPFIGARHSCLYRPFSLTAVNMARVSEPIKKDHRELEDYYNRIVNSTDPEEQTRYQNLFTWELARHSIGEELIVYPVIEKSLPDGPEMVNKDRSEHQKVKEQLYQFQKLKAGEVSFLPTLNDLFRDLKQHIREEEEEDLPQLEKALTHGESEKLAANFDRAKKFAPTRSHPSAPDKPPFETVAGLMAAPMDKLMDMFRKFPQ